MIRFSFGAGVSGLAGAVSALTVPRLGGVFLAFPAILLASLTLRSRDEGVRPGHNTHGAAAGALGLFAFAVVAAATLTRWPVWLAMTAASASWVIVGLGGDLIVTRRGLGKGEPPAHRRER
ncbi:hypothetical protein SAMN05444365_106132 [Micromonospora pattaloongensis]|uniref:DUF3147 family protein n=1 Tax=Micromonospora pattaloongensis TaxID=405436 RepID=A0A1H3QTZ8_9ACTN|nr:hypothetical protein [Micromonospora pattaloongensis]SDZ16994.1 hypothetical protein SAMN05444365_106132 [Micromonospora pattaloongensis]